MSGVVAEFIRNLVCCKSKDFLFDPAICIMILEIAKNILSHCYLNCNHNLAYCNWENLSFEFILATIVFPPLYANYFEYYKQFTSKDNEHIINTSSATN